MARVCTEQVAGEAVLGAPAVPSAAAQHLRDKEHHVQPQSLPVRCSGPCPCLRKSVAFPLSTFFQVQNMNFVDRRGLCPSPQSLSQATPVRFVSQGSGQVCLCPVASTQSCCWPLSPGFSCRCHMRLEWEEGTELAVSVLRRAGKYCLNLGLILLPE